LQVLKPVSHIEDTSEQDEQTSEHLVPGGYLTSKQFPSTQHLQITSSGFPGSQEAPSSAQLLQKSEHLENA